jgi:hypothetical protein
MPSYRVVNKVKANFDEVYQAPTPHAYFTTMNQLEYAIGQEARPFFLAAVALLRRQLQNQAPIRMLDLGCSYGVGSALVKYGFTFGEIADFFSSHSDTNYRQCVKDTKEWLAENGPAQPLTCVGADASAEAIKFGAETGLLDGGIAHDLEADQRLTPEECALIQKCNLLISTGAIGYVGERTLQAILQQLGKAKPLPRGPYIVVTILRMFAPETISKTFMAHEYKFTPVPGVHLRQRRFHDDTEQAETIRLVEARGLDASTLEADGYHYADLFVGAPAADHPELLQAMADTWLKLQS